MTDSRTAHHDPRLVARVISREPLLYAAGADTRTDRPRHVRAGSSLAPVPGGLIVVQDDSNFLAMFDPAKPSAARSIMLPPGPGGQRQFGDSRANKHLKLDLEACVAVMDPAPLFLALGSGSTPARESVVMVSGWEKLAARGEDERKNGVADEDFLCTTLVAAPQLYASLRQSQDFAGSEMNIEGALLSGPVLRIFSRGNGALKDGRAPVNASCDLVWAEVLAHLSAPDEHPAPAPSGIRRFALGQLDGTALGFTDAASWEGRVLFSAAAEDSVDAVADGPVAGSAIGIIDGDLVRWTPIVDQSGEVLREKAEGLVVADGTGDELWVVADADSESRPSDLWRVRLEGPWRNA